MIRKLNTRGDTIIEVLIAVVVLSVVLTTAYALATRSLKENQQTQEHNQALKVAESQIEALKAFYDNGGTPPTNASGFCFKADGGIVNGFPGGVPSANLPDNLTVGGTGYPANCTQTLAQNGVCTPADEGTCYFFAIRYNNSRQAYTATVRWDGVISDQDQVNLTYGLFP